MNDKKPIALYPFISIATSIALNAINYGERGKLRRVKHQLKGALAGSCVSAGNAIGFRLKYARERDQRGLKAMQMPSYEEVLSLAQQLQPDEQSRLLQALSHLVYLPIAVEGSDEVISPEEIAESEAALQDYFAGRDRGMSAKELKRQFLGEDLG